MIKDLGNNRYRFVVSVGGRTDRRRFSKTITHKGGKRELKQLYKEFETECKNAPRTDITVTDLVESYIAYSRTLGRKATTIKGYEIAAERIYSSVGTILAKSLTTYRLEKFVAEMVDNGFASKTMRNTITLLSAAYRHAIYIGQLESNPCERITIPKGQPRDIRILYIDEIQSFLDAISEVDLNEKVAYELALFCGLRRSEILGLKEADVDIVRGVMHIHNTRHRVDGEDIEQDTKTVRSTRTLALPDILIMDIAILLEAHRQFKYEKTDFLIWDGFGNPLGGQALASRLNRLEERKGLPHVTLHGLRHTYASLLHDSGVDMAAVSANLGHSNLATTMNIYTHIVQSASQASKGIANTINALTSEAIPSVTDNKVSDIQNDYIESQNDCVEI